MPNPSQPNTRQQKLAEKLRDNLKRRKAQTRSRNPGPSGPAAGKTEAEAGQKKPLARKIICRPGSVNFAIIMVQ